MADEIDRIGDLGGGFGQRLALLLREQPGEVVGLALEPVGPRKQHLPAFRDRAARPGGERCLGRRDRRVELGFRGAGALGQHLLGRGVHDRHGLVAGDELSVDQQVIVSHVVFLSMGAGARGLSEAG